MTVLRLAGNVIDLIDFTGFSHLQLVRDDNGAQQEIEVQVGPFGPLGDWTFPNIPRDHTNADNTKGFGDPDRYSAAELDLGDRLPDEVWDVLEEIHGEFQDKGTGINYDLFQNSNSYVNTLLYMIGIDLTSELIEAVTPGDGGNIVGIPFPGSGTNVVLLPNDFDLIENLGNPDIRVIDFDLSLTNGNDYVRTGIGDDTIDGGNGNDTIVAGRGSDIVNGGAGNDVIFGGIDDGSLLFADDNDILDGGAGFDILAYQGSIDDYEIDFSAQTINGPKFNDQDSYQNAELASFEDGIVALETRSFADIQAGLGLGSLDAVAEAIMQAELGDAVSNVSYTGSGNAAFLVSQFAIGSVFSLDGGFFLSSGGFPGNANTSGSFGIGNGQPGDADLSAVASAAFGGAGQTFDASVLEFDLNVTDADIDGISFDLVFGSDEFPEFSNSSFVDVAAVFVNGENVALFNDDPSTPLSVIDSNLVNGNFIDNTSGAFSTQWDGFSQVLSVRADLSFGLNNIKIGIADTGDSAYDSGLYVTNIDLLGGGGTGSGILIVKDGTDGDDEIDAGLSAEEINLFSGSDTVKGSKEELDGDVITGFFEDDVITVVGETFAADDITVTFGSAILDIDTDQDGESDLTLTLEGDFDGAIFCTEIVDGNTNIAVKFAPLVNEVVGTNGRDNLVGTAEDDMFIFNGGFGDVGRGNGGDDAFDLSANSTNGVVDNTRIVDWSDDVLLGITLEDVNLETVRSSNTALRFTYGDDNDVLTITGDVSGGIESIFETQEVA